MAIVSPVSNAAFPVALASSLNLNEPMTVADSRDEAVCDGEPSTASAVGPPAASISAQQLLTSTIQRLISQFDAIAVTNHFQGADGKWSELTLCGEVVEEIRPKAAALVAQAIATQQVQSQILSSRHQHFLVAVPLPGTSDVAISVLFRQDNSKNSSLFFESRTREVTLVAAYLALVQTSAASLAGHSKPGTSNRSENVAGALASQPSLHVRLKQFLAENRYDLRLYVVATVALLLIGLIPWQYSVQCDVVCEPAQRRFVAAPFDSKLLKSLVAPGDQVEQGQILAMLDGGELQSQIASLQAKMDQAIQRRSAALSSGDGSKAELERLEVQYLGSEIQLLGDRKRNLEVRSPITGMVVSGDLERAEGVPLKVGENLFEIAPLDQLVAEIAIPEADVLHIASGMTTNIKLDATPGFQHQAELTRIHPRNEIRDNVSVFVAEAFIDNLELKLRPGMSGSASIAAGRRPIAWLLFHRPYEALRELIGW